MAFLLPFIPAIAEAVGTGALTGGAGYLAGSALKKLGFILALQENLLSNTPFAIH